MITIPPFNLPPFQNSFQHSIPERHLRPRIDKAKATVCTQLSDVLSCDRSESKLNFRAWSLYSYHVPIKHLDRVWEDLNLWFAEARTPGMNCFEAEILVATRVAEVVAPWLAARKVEDDIQARRDVMDERIPLEYRLPIDLRRLPDPEAFARCQPWIKNPKHRSLFLVGPTGTGKTRTAYHLLRELYVETQIGFQDWTSIELKDEVIERSFEPPNTEAGLIAFIRKLCNCPILFLDDLAQAKLTAAYAEKLIDVLEFRTANHRPVIATCQLESRALIYRLAGPNGEFQDVAEAIERRLRDFFDFVRFRLPKSPGNRGVAKPGP